jgi:hypothetical protein
VCQVALVEQCDEGTAYSFSQLSWTTFWTTFWTTATLSTKSHPITKVACWDYLAKWTPARQQSHNFICNLHQELNNAKRNNPTQNPI